MANDAMDTNNQQSLGSTEYQLKKYLLLLATLVATVTYAAGLNPPGGSWLEDSPSPGGRRIAGDSILRQTNYRRYIVFYCFNAFPSRRRSWSASSSSSCAMASQGTCSTSCTR